MPSQNETLTPVISKSAVDPGVDQRAELMFQLLVGEIAGKRGNVDQAMFHYSKASELSDSPKVASRAARIASFAKDYEVALASAQRWASLEPGSEEAQQAVGLLLVKMDRPQEALQHFKQVIDKEGEKNYEVSFARLGLTFGRKSISDAELKVMNLLRQAYPEVVHAQRTYAELAYRKNEYKNALTALDDGLAVAPNDRPSVVLRNRVLLATGQVDEALEGMQKLLSLSPDDPELRHGYARMLVQAKRYEQALAEYEKIIKIKPKDLDVIYSAALLKIELKYYDEARVNLKKLLDSPHHNNEAYYYLGRIEEEQKVYDQAISWFARIHRGEYFLEAQIRIATMLSRLGELDEARQHLARVRNETVDESFMVRLYLAEGQLLRDEGLHPEAYDFYDDALQVYSTNIDLLYARAMTAEKLGHIEWLERDLKAVLVIEPDNSTALNALGYTLADHSIRLDEAMEYIKRALSLRPDDPAILDSMGWVLYRQGRYEEAETYLRKAYRAMEDAEIAGHLSEVLWVRGQYDEAKEMVTKALKVSPDDHRLLKLKERFFQ